jgi:ribonuclease PH
VDLEKIGERTLLLDCDVIQADGGTRVASVTGGYIALVLGLKPLIEAGEIPPDALISQIAAVSVGMIQGQPILDLNYAEDSQADVDLNIVMTSESKIIEIQGTAEGNPFPRKDLDRMISLAENGIHQIIALQEALLN